MTPWKNIKAENLSATIDDFVHHYDQYTWFDEEAAIAYLLLDNVIFPNTAKYTFNHAPDHVGETIVLFVNINDVFEWGCADAEDVLCSGEINDPKNELYKLLKLHLEDRSWGVIKWACYKRFEQPQPPIKRDMIAAGAWDEGMNLLPENKGVVLRREWARLKEKVVEYAKHNAYFKDHIEEWDKNHTYIHSFLRQMEEHNPQEFLVMKTDLAKQGEDLPRFR